VIALAGSTEIGALGCATVSGIVLGASQMASGAVEDARVSLERSIELATQGSLAPQRLQGDLLLATVHGLAGDLGRAETGFRAAIGALTAVKSPYNEAQARLGRGFVLATHPAGDAASGLEDLDAASATFESLGARPSQARTMRARGMALARLGRTDDADVSLQRAATMAAEMDLKDAPWPSTAAELQALRAAEPPIRLVE
jgi:Tfp pilus assembly protein PilF